MDLNLLSDYQICMETKRKMLNITRFMVKLAEYD